MADTHDLAGRVDKLSEAVALLGERVTRVEAEQRAMRSSIDQLIGEVRQLERRVEDLRVHLDQRLGDFDQRLGDFDKRLDAMRTQFDKRLDAMSAQFDRRLSDMSHQFDQRLEALNKRITGIRWMISTGMGIIVLLMTLYRFVSFGASP